MQILQIHPPTLVVSSLEEDSWTISKQIVRAVWAEEAEFMM